MGEPIGQVLAGGAITKGSTTRTDKSMPDDCRDEAPVYWCKPLPCLLDMLLVYGLRRIVRGLLSPPIRDYVSRCGTSILLYCRLL